MSRKLIAHVSLWADNGSVVSFAPGDELPDWAEGKVGAHCLDSGAPDAKIGASRVDPSEEAEPESPKSTATPDFTSAAPRRGRPRK